MPRRDDMPSLFDNEQFRKMMETITAHRLFKVIDTRVSFAHTVHCMTCGELSVDHDQEFHIASKLYEDGFRQIV